MSLNRGLLATACLVASMLTHAANAATPFKMRVPIGPQPGAASLPPATPASLTRAAASLPPATITAPYSFDFKTLLTIGGDNPPAMSQVLWQAVGAVPDGLVLGADGVLSGTPTTVDETGASFEIAANHDAAGGQQTYMLYVNGAVLVATQIAAGQHHTCAVTSGGGVKCWGYNGNGELGDGTLTQRLTPVDVAGLASGVVSIQAGDAFSCALLADGSAKCWGLNGYGQLGDGTTTQSTTPVTVTGLSGAVKISSGRAHTCAVTGAGAAKCWGYGQYGQLGDGGGTNKSTAVDVVGLASGVTDIAAARGGMHSCAVLADGAAKCWGYNYSGQLGNGTNGNSAAPVAVSGLAGATRLTLGQGYSCAITTTGVKCWGLNNFGQLGDNSYVDRWTPVAVSGLAAGETTSIDAGRQHNCATTVSGTAYCWGEGGWSALGNGTTANRAMPTAVNLVNPVTFVAAGSFHSCAITASGAAKCWGTGGNGRLGNGATAAQLLPVNVQP